MHVYIAIISCRLQIIYIPILSEVRGIPYEQTNNFIRISLLQKKLEFAQRESYQDARDLIQMLKCNPKEISSLPEALSIVFATQSPITIVPFMNEFLRNPDFQPDEKVIATGFLAQYLNEHRNVRPMPNLLTPLFESLDYMLVNVPEENKTDAKRRVKECIESILNHRDYASSPNDHKVLFQKDIDRIQKELEENSIRVALLDFALSNGANPNSFATWEEFQEGYHKLQELLETYNIGENPTQPVPLLLYQVLHIYEKFIKDKNNYEDLDLLSLHIIKDFLQLEF